MKRFAVILIFTFVSCQSDTDKLKSSAKDKAEKAIAHAMSVSLSSGMLNSDEIKIFTLEYARIERDSGFFATLGFASAIDALASAKEKERLLEVKKEIAKIK